MHADRSAGAGMCERSRLEDPLLERKQAMVTRSNLDDAAPDTVAADVCDEALG